MLIIMIHDKRNESPWNMRYVSAIRLLFVRYNRPKQIECVERKSYSTQYNVHNMQTDGKSQIWLCAIDASTISFQECLNIDVYTSTKLISLWKLHKNGRKLLEKIPW